MPQLGENYQPSPQGKVSAGIAAGIVGVGAYASYRTRMPKPAQTGVKVPSSANTPPRGASHATNSYTSYSAYAKTSVGVQNLENSFRMRSGAGGVWRGGAGAVAAPVIGTILGNVLSPIINPPILNGLVSASRRFNGINAPEEAALRWAIKTGEVKDISTAVGYLDRFRARQKQLGLTS